VIFFPHTDRARRRNGRLGFALPPAINIAGPRGLYCAGDNQLTPPRKAKSRCEQPKAGLNRLAPMLSTTRQLRGMMNKLLRGDLEMEA
jgi:hypothetical protein